MPRKKISRKLSDSYADWPFVNAGLRYAEEVVSGKIPAGQYTILACERQLRDLTRKRKWPYYFDPQEAERVCQILELFPHVKGPKAGDPFLAEPWQLFIDTTVYGWRDKLTHYRRFHEVYECVPRKNGKSIRGATKGLYMLTLDGENGPEVFAGNISEIEANKIWKPAQMMVKRTPDFRDDCGVEALANSIVTPADGGAFSKLIGQPADGDNPSCALIDEYHQHKSDHLYETMKTGMGARENWLIWIMTTAGNSFGGSCYEYQKDIERILAGAVKDEEKFGIIYHADEKDDWDDPLTLRKANPNMGVSVSERFLLARQAEAVTTPRRQSAFKTKHLNIWTSAHTVYLNMVKWRRCQNSQLNIEDFYGRQCVSILDLASKSDLAAYIKLFPEMRDGKIHYTAFGKYYLPEGALIATSDDGESKRRNSQASKYQAWQAAGLLNVHDDEEIDFSLITKDVEDDLDLFLVDEVIFDPWRATMIAQQVAKAGAETVEYHNTVKNMSEPMKELEAAVNGKRFHFDGDPILTWMAGNVMAREDANHNVFPRKEGERNMNKIDGIVASIMGIGRLMYRDDIPDMDEVISELVIA